MNKKFITSIKPLKKTYQSINDALEKDWISIQPHLEFMKDFTKQAEESLAEMLHFKDDLEKCSNDEEKRSVALLLENYLADKLKDANDILQSMESAANAINKFRETTISMLGDYLNKTKQWQKDSKLSVATMAEYGWFPNWYTFEIDPRRKFDNLDKFMITHINQCWDDLKQKIIFLCPERKHILKVAFDLHEHENYIASIPLLLTQSDGICSEEYSSYFFTKDPNTSKTASDNIIQEVEMGEHQIGYMTKILLEPFKIKLQISQGASKASKTTKEKGPNRHGIIHGSKKHLDYGTKVNGYKAFSFLAFIVYTVKDEFKHYYNTF